MSCRRFTCATGIAHRNLYSTRHQASAAFAGRPLLPKQKRAAQDGFQSLSEAVRIRLIELRGPHMKTLGAYALKFRVGRQSQMAATGTNKVLPCGGIADHQFEFPGFIAIRTANRFSAGRVQPKHPHSLLSGVSVQFPQVTKRSRRSKWFGSPAVAALGERYESRWRNIAQRLRHVTEILQSHRLAFYSARIEDRAGIFLWAVKR